MNTHARPQRHSPTIVRVLVAVGFIGIVVALALYLMLGNVAGGGAAYQDAPESVMVGEKYEIVFRFGVWGSGGEVSTRLSNVKLHLDFESKHNYEISASSVQRDGERMIYRFQSQAPATQGEIKYYFKFIFDGQLKRVDGLRPIVVGGA